MDCRTVRLDAQTWSIEEEEVRFFLLAGDREALLIDSGMKTENAREIAEGLTALPIRLLNTHADGDHIGSNREFDSFYMSLSEASNYYRGPGRTGRIDPVWDGDILDLGNRKLEIIAIPGHTPGSIGVLDVKRRALFSGDPVQDADIFLFGVQRELHAYIAGLRRLEGMRERFDMLYPSHGTCPVSPDLIPLLAEAAERILDGTAKSVPDEFHGIQIRRFDFGFASMLCDA